METSKYQKGKRFFSLEKAVNHYNTGFYIQLSF